MTIPILLKAGADASKITDKGTSVFHLYCEGSSPQVVDALVQHGGDINAVISADSGEDAGASAIHLMMKNYLEDIILKFLENGPEINVKNRNGDTALHLRSKQHGRSQKVLRKLLEMGADVNARNNLGQTPIHHCLIENVQLLVDAGASLDIADHEGRTPLSLALDQSQCIKAIDAALKLGANINVRDNEGQSILHLAIPKTESRILNLLVERGADPFAIDNFGDTLLHKVARQSGYEGVQRPLDHLYTIANLGVSPKTRNHQGQNALHIAIGTLRRSSDVRFLDFFLDPAKGIDVNEADNYGIRPLHIAASLSERYVERLLRAGADPYLLTFENDTVLHVAAKNRQSNIVGLFVERFERDRRMDFINTTDHRGRTALHGACRSGRPEMVQILLEAGVDVHKYDHLNRTALHVCAEIPEERAFWRSDTRAPGARRLNAGKSLQNSINDL